MPEQDATRRTVEAIWRIEAGRLIAALARVTRDVGLAEDLAQEAMLAALERWPSSGVPPNPAGWLMTTAKNKAVDAARRQNTYQGKLEAVGRDTTAVHDDVGDVEERLDDHIGDELLRLIFTAAHPVLSPEARVTLTLRCLGGLTAGEIARALLITESAATRRITRAKRTLEERNVGFEMPSPGELDARLSTVLEVVYLIFNEGYTATSGSDWTRPELCAEALRLARIIAGRLPDHPEVHGFAALLELQAARIPARNDADGNPVLLDEQDRRLWDKLLIRRGLAALARAEQLASAPPPPDGGRARGLGKYSLQAAVAACHARAARIDDTDWGRIAALYEVLRHVWPNPIVEVNRAVAVGRDRGPAAGLAIVDRIADAPELARYPQLYAVRANLLERAGQISDAQAAYERAAELSNNEQERRLYRDRAERCSNATAT